MKKFYILLLLTGFCFKGFGESTYVPNSGAMNRMLHRFHLWPGEGEKLPPTTFKFTFNGGVSTFSKNTQNNYGYFNRLAPFDLEPIKNNGGHWCDFTYFTFNMVPYDVQPEAHEAILRCIAHRTSFLSKLQRSQSLALPLVKNMKEGIFTLETFLHSL